MATKGEMHIAASVMLSMAELQTLTPEQSKAVLEGIAKVLAAAKTRKG